MASSLDIYSSWEKKLSCLQPLKLNGTLYFELKYHNRARTHLRSVRNFSFHKITPIKKLQDEHIEYWSQYYFIMLWRVVTKRDKEEMRWNEDDDRIWGWFDNKHKIMGLFMLAWEKFSLHRIMDGKYYFGKFLDQHSEKKKPSGHQSVYIWWDKFQGNAFLNHITEKLKQMLEFPQGLNS